MSESLLTGRAGLAVLIDPDRTTAAGAVELARRAAGEGAALLLLGNSFGPAGEGGGLSSRLKRAAPELPLVQFPAMASQLDAGVDAVLLLSLISGRNAQYLIEEHVRAVPFFLQHPEVRGDQHRVLPGGRRPRDIGGVGEPDAPSAGGQAGGRGGAPARGGIDRDARGVSGCGKWRVARGERGHRARGARRRGGGRCWWAEEFAARIPCARRETAARISWSWAEHSRTAERAWWVRSRWRRAHDRYPYALAAGCRRWFAVRRSNGAGARAISEGRRDGARLHAAPQGDGRASRAPRAVPRRYSRISWSTRPRCRSSCSDGRSCSMRQASDLRAPHLHLGDSRAALVEFPRMQVPLGATAGDSAHQDERGDTRDRASGALS